MFLFGGPKVRYTGGGTVGRAWSRPIRYHVVALGLILLALLPFVGTSASFSTDEGAAIVEAQSLAGGGGWVVEHPVQEVDPDGRHYPLELSERGPRGFVAYGKHPAYAILLAGAEHLGGVTAMVVLSLAGTLAAAALAAALARRIDPGLARPTLWTVGLATPLLFDGFLVMAHTLGAAFAAGAVLAAVVALERRSVVLAAAVAPLVAGSVLMRSEAVFLALGLAAAALVVAVLRPQERIAAALIGIGAGAAGAGVPLFETWWLTRITGAGSSGLRSAPSASEPDGFLAGRLQSFLRTVVLPTHGGDRMTTLLLFVMVTALACGALRARRDPDRPGPVLAFALVAAVAAVAALLVAAGTVVSGLLVAFPIALVGLLLVRRRTLRTPAARISIGVFTVFAACVVAAQYTVGGSVEWGGRFFALGLPLLVPVLLLALKEQGALLPPRTSRWAAVALVVCSVAVATTGVASLRHQHRRLGQLMTMADDAGREAAGPGERPVMVATFGSVGRWAWRTFDDQRWLTTDPADLADLLARLHDAGVSEVGLVTPDVDRDIALLGSGSVVSSEASGLAHGWHVLVLRTS